MLGASCYHQELQNLATNRGVQPIVQVRPKFLLLIHKPLKCGTTQFIMVYKEGTLEKWSSIKRNLEEISSQLSSMDGDACMWSDEIIEAIDFIQEHLVNTCWVVYSNANNNGHGGWIYHEPKCINKEEIEEIYEKHQYNSMADYEVFDSLDDAELYRRQHCIEEVECCDYKDYDYNFNGEADFYDKLMDRLYDTIIEWNWNETEQDLSPIYSKLNPLTNRRKRK